MAPICSKLCHAAIALLLLLSSAVLGQQRETFDILSYTPPKGWQKESTNDALSYLVANNQTGDWCRITVYKSIGSSGNLATDFAHEWNELVTKAYPNTTRPTPELSSEDGWSVQAGSANFTWQNRQSLILLNVISGYERLASITVSTNTRAYQGIIENFLDSIEMKKMGNNNTNTSSQTNTTQNQTQKPVGASGTGISKATTTFNDGWTAQALQDYVLVTKENTKFYMHYGFPIPIETRGADETQTTKANWDRFVAPRYNLSNLWLNPDVGSFGGSFNYYAEGTGTEKSTGKEVFIGFRTIINGAYFCVEAVAPNKAEYQKHFPTLRMLEDMRGSNRFALTKADISGEWSSTSGSTLQYYNVYTGQSAGMSATQGDETFIFQSAGNYNATLSGIMGQMGGSQKYYNKKYQGKFSVSDWEITLTNYGGKTQVFTAYFEAVKGGRILHIAKKDAPGIRYALVKVK